MKGLGLLMVAAAVGVAGAAVVYAVKQHQGPMGEHLPPPGSKCASAADVWAGTNAVLSEPNHTGNDLRAAAQVLKDYQDFCDDAAKQAATAAVTVLETRATMLDNGSAKALPHLPPAAAKGPVNVPGGFQFPTLGTVAPLPVEIPGGQYYAGYGWCPPGAELNLFTGMCEFPQEYAPGAAQAAAQGAGAGVGTAGCGCASCQAGYECEGCG